MITLYFSAPTEKKMMDSFKEHLVDIDGVKTWLSRVDGADLDYIGHIVEQEAVLEGETVVTPAVMSSTVHANVLCDCPAKAATYKDHPYIIDAPSKPCRVFGG